MAYGNVSNIPSRQPNMAAVTASAAEINDLDGVTDGTVIASKAVIVDASKDVTGFNDVTVGGDVNITGDVNAATGTIVDLTASGYTLVARTATATGATTGTIADAGSYQSIAVTAKAGDADGIIILPTPTPGTVLDLACAATGYELRSSAPNTVAINGGTDAAGEAAIPANSLAHIVCVSATAWIGYTITGTTLASMEAAAD